MKIQRFSGSEKILKSLPIDKEKSIKLSTDEDLILKKKKLMIVKGSFFLAEDNELVEINLGHDEHLLFEKEGHQAGLKALKPVVCYEF